jgi:uncharacterized coiled-coil protein SlyX
MSEATTETPTTAQIIEQLTCLQEHVEELEAKIEKKDERIADLEAQVADLEARGEAATRKRNHLAEEIGRVEDVATERAGGDADTEKAEPPADTDVPQTPLEQVVGLPESLADTELTANQKRARFVARDVRDYAEKVPAGYAIPSTDLRKVLKAKEGSTPHTQTVARVMDFLDELGGEGTTLVERRGTKRIAFSEEAVARLDEHASRAQAEPDVDAGPGGAITDVVIGGS